MKNYHFDDVDISSLDFNLEKDLAEIDDLYEVSLPIKNEHNTEEKERQNPANEVIRKEPFIDFRDEETVLAFIISLLFMIIFLGSMIGYMKWYFAQPYPQDKIEGYNYDLTSQQ